MCQRRHLPRVFETACGPLGPEGGSLTKNTPFDGFSAGPRRSNQLAAGVEFWFTAIFAGLEFAGLLNRQRFAAKRPATPHANLAALRLSITAEWDRLAAVQIRKTCCSFRRRRSAVAKKNEVKLNKLLAKGPADTNQFFSGLKKASISHEGLYSEKKTF
jgi:hypothetical protein